MQTNGEYMKFKIKTGLGRKLFVKFTDNTRKKLRIEALFKIIGNKINTKEFVYVQIYDEDGHLLYNEKLRFYGDKLIKTI